MTATFSTQIEIDGQGVAWIAGTKVKVTEIILDKFAYGWSPEEMHFQHPHLSLGQIHAALSYYHDHQQELDAEIERRDRQVEELRAQASNPLTRQELLNRLEAQGDETKSSG